MKGKSRVGADKDMGGEQQQRVVVIPTETAQPNKEQADIISEQFGTHEMYPALEAQYWEADIPKTEAQ